MQTTVGWQFQASGTHLHPSIFFSMFGGIRASLLKRSYLFLEQPRFEEISDLGCSTGVVLPNLKLLLVAIFVRCGQVLVHLLLPQGHGSPFPPVKLRLFDRELFFVCRKGTQHHLKAYISFKRCQRSFRTSCRSHIIQLGTRRADFRHVFWCKIVSIGNSRLL